MHNKKKPIALAAALAVTLVAADKAVNRSELKKQQKAKSRNLRRR